MTGKEYMRGNWVKANSSRNNFRETMLITIASLFLLPAVMSQSFIGYYAADYYAQIPGQQGLNLDAIKEQALNLRDKTIKGINVANIENLINFDCKK